MEIIDGQRHRGEDVAVEDGSATLFVVISMVVMFTLIILVVDIGQLVFERIRLQTVVDACTYAAATQQAVGLNEIADLNWSAKREYLKARIFVGSGKWYSRSHAKRAFRFHQTVLQTIDRYRQQANRIFARNAESIAQRVKLQNLPNSKLESVAPTGQGSRLIGSYSTERKRIWYKYYLSTCRGDKCPWPIVKMYRYPDDPHYYGGHQTYYSIPRKRLGTGFGSGMVPVQWTKKKYPTTYAAYKLTQEAKPFILGNKLFDLTRMTLPKKIPKKYESYIRKLKTSVRMPQMVAYSAARPTRGTIYGGDVRYSPIFNRLNALSPAPRIPYGILAKMEH